MDKFKRLSCVANKFDVNFKVNLHRCLCRCINKPSQAMLIVAATLMNRPSFSLVRIAKEHLGEIIQFTCKSIHYQSGRRVKKEMKKRKKNKNKNKMPNTRKISSAFMLPSAESHDTHLMMSSCICSPSPLTI